jgi:hypothetical protein
MECLPMNPWSRYKTQLQQLNPLLTIAEIQILTIANFDWTQLP